jgi:dTDP-glucose pyrophosphorylase
MINFLDICIKPTLSIEEAMGVINRGNVRIACVVDVNNRLLGTLNDGDIRRGILKGKSLSDSINDVYHTNAIFADESTTKAKLLNLCLQKQINQIPIIDNNKKIVDLFVLNDPLSRKQHGNNVVLMVGGLGTRLRPLTENTPKPMLKVGGKPILQTIVEGFAKSGFTNISMCLGYKSNIIKNFFQDGGEFGVNIDYVVEDKRMGTAGALTLLTKKLDKPFFVMNGDLLTNVDYENMLDFHSSNDSKATMCVRKYDIEVPYGVVSTINEEITSIKEKPIHRFFVNAGIYLLEPGCVDLIPKGEFYDMPSLFDKLISNNEKVVSFPLKEYWIDIGQMDDFNQAHNDYIEVFVD